MPAEHLAYALLVSQYCIDPFGLWPIGMARVSMCSASDDAAEPSLAAQDVAAVARWAKRMDCESSAFAVLADVKITMSPKALSVATAMLFDAPDEEVEVKPVPSRAAAAAEAASPEE